MFIPPRIRTQFPSDERTYTEKILPIPIESAYFMEDAKQDPARMNRFYFDFPGHWMTANNGENIIGIRNITINPRRRKIEFDLSVRKYLRKAFYDKKYEKINDKQPNLHKTTDEIYELLKPNEKGEVMAHIVSRLGNKDDLRKLYADIRSQMKVRFDKYNEKVMKDNGLTLDEILKTNYEFYKNFSSFVKKFPSSWNAVNNIVGVVYTGLNSAVKLEEKLGDFYKNHIKQLIPLFHLDDNDSSRNDIQINGYYDIDRNSFVETISSPCNVEIKKYTNSSPEPSTPTPKPTPSPSPSPGPTPTPTAPFVEVNENTDTLIDSLYFMDFKIDFNEKLTDKNYPIYDFVDVFNIGKEPFQNDPDKYKNKWLRRLDFLNVWNRKPCCVYSSIAEQSHNHYIGSSDINYTPIKYFKLKSTDQSFWIELYSPTYCRIPIKLPTNEAFCIEMQFLPFDKKLNV